MWEIPIYFIFIPVLTLTISLISTIKFKRYFFAPLVLFVTLNIPTVVMPLVYNVGWEAILGWAIFYTIVSLVISLVVWIVRKKDSSPKPIS